MDDTLRRFERRVQESGDPSARESWARHALRANPADVRALWAMRRLKPGEPEWMNRLNEALVARRTAPNGYPVVIDYSMSLEEMIAEGRYDEVDSDIRPERFPIAEKGFVETEVILVILNAVTNQQAEAELENRGLRPATIEELLAKYAQHNLPWRFCCDDDTTFFIVALGSRCVLDDDEGVVVLSYSVRKCELWLDDDARDEWGDNVQFAAVRK